MLPSVMATLKMSGGKIDVLVVSSNSSGSLPELEIMIDGERKGNSARESFPLSAGKHHVTVRAKEHKPFEKDVFFDGWGEDQFLSVTLERTASSQSGAKPK